MEDIIRGTMVWPPPMMWPTSRLDIREKTNYMRYEPGTIFIDNRNGDAYRYKKLYFKYGWVLDGGLKLWKI